MPRLGRSFPSKPIRSKTELAPQAGQIPLVPAQVRITAYPVTPQGKTLSLPVAQVNAAAPVPSIGLSTQPFLIQQITGSDISGYGLGTTLVSTSAGSTLVLFAAWDTINTNINLNNLPSPAPRTTIDSPCSIACTAAAARSLREAFCTAC